MKAQQGSVIIITLWTLTLLTILVTVIASQIRLSARVVYFQQEQLQVWASILSASNQAGMELMLARMPLPAEAIDNLNDINRNPLYRYNGQQLQLAYASADNIGVRIYDHAGKINLRALGPARMRLLLENRLGTGQTQQIEQLLGAWADWQDLNDGSNINGAERDYYEALDQPFSPRNGKIENIEEILHIRGFAEVFTGINLDAAFTLHTGEGTVNLNLATKEAMQLLPGLDDALITDILLYRQDNDFINNDEISQLVPFENMVQLRLWMDNSATSDFYTIMTYEKPESGALTSNMTGYSETVQVSSFAQKPNILKVSPYATIPASVTITEQL